MGAGAARRAGRAARLLLPDLGRKRTELRSLVATPQRPTLPDLARAPHPTAQESIVIVEYPKKLAHLVRERLGPLEKLRDRRYGRTYLAIYGPAGADA